MHSVTTAWKPAKQEHRAKSTSVHAALTMGAISRYCELSDFYGFDLKSSSRAVTCAFCQPHLPKVLRTLQFFNGANRALAAVWCVFCRPDLPKVPRPCREKQIFDQKLSLQSRALFGRDRGPHPRKQRPSGDPEGHFIPEKTEGLAPESVFTREFTPPQSGTLPYCPHTREPMTR